MRGYFGIGAEGISKSMNLGTLLRTGHAFGASFVFTIAANYSKRDAKWADTSNSFDQVPLYSFDKQSELVLPKNCKLVGVELVDDAVWLPSFKHPSIAAYVLGREKGSLSPELLARCDHVVKIPTKFCVNLGVAGAIVMYDRMLAYGKFAERPVSSQNNSVEIAEQIFAMPRQRQTACPPLPPAEF